MNALALQNFQKPAVMESSRMIAMGFRKIKVPRDPQVDPLAVYDSAAGANDPKATEWQDNLLFETTPCPFFGASGSTRVIGVPPVDIPFPFTQFNGDLTQGFTGGERSFAYYDFVVRAGINYHTNDGWLLLLPGAPIPAHYSQSFYNVRVSGSASAGCTAALKP